jgi:hypothetical protein
VQNAGFPRADCAAAAGAIAGGIAVKVGESGWAALSAISALETGPSWLIGSDCIDWFAGKDANIVCAETHLPWWMPLKYQAQFLVWLVTNMMSYRRYT